MLPEATQERVVPTDLPRPSFDNEGKPGPALLSEADCDGLRAAARIASQVLDAACAAVRPGVTTDEIDFVAHEKCLELGAWPTGLGFRGFPKSCCTSVNEVRENLCCSPLCL
eukprot:SAG31_NODE_7517_length_1666_cov_2.518188_1_plen_112_part_00